jgi:hypothetical protein
VKINKQSFIITTVKSLKLKKRGGNPFWVISFLDPKNTCEFNTVDTQTEKHSNISCILDVFPDSNHCRLSLYNIEEKMVKNATSIHVQCRKKTLRAVAGPEYHTSSRRYCVSV